MSITRCPYCNKEVDIDLTAIDVEEVQEQECPHCDKTFAFTCEVSVDIYPRKADCLNGGEHNYSLFNPNIHGAALLMICNACGHERFLTKEEEIRFKEKKYTRTKK